MNKKITSKDIANHANVSQATVSYVLNNTPGKSISADTRKRVMEAVEKLNYIPNSAAKRLKNSSSECIAVRLVTTLNTPRYYHAIQGIRSFLDSKGYNILICNDQIRNNTFNYIDSYLNTQTDGIIYIASDNSDIPENALAQIKKYGIPFSSIDCMSDNEDICSINYDYFASSYQRADYLLKKGFKKFIYIRPDYDNKKETEREKGFMAAIIGNEEIIYKIEVIKAWDANQRIYSHNDFSFEPSATMIKSLKHIVDSVSTDTCFICSSREIQQIVSLQLYKQHLKLKTAETEKWYERSISYHFSHYDSGYEAARSLFELINKQGSIRKLTLRPILEMVDPEVY